MSATLRTLSGMALAATVALAACGDDDDAATSTPPAATTETTETTGSTESPGTTEAVATTDGAETTAAAETTEAPETTAAAEGFVFTAPEGDYTIVFPGEPTPTEQEAPLPDGTTLPLTFYFYETADFATGTTRFEYDPGVAIPLEQVRDGALAAIPGATLVSSEPITQQGREGLEFVAEVSSGGVAGHYISRVFADGPILYQVLFVGASPGVSPGAPQVVAFFDSFRFTEDR